MPQRRHTSMGEMISSVVFFTMGAWLISESLVAETTWKAILIAACGFSSFLAAFRYHLGRLYDAITAAKQTSSHDRFDGGTR